MATNEVSVEQLERNREVIHRFYRAVNAKEREVFYDIVHPEFVNHGGAAGDIVGPKALVDSLDPFYAAMPDWHVSEDYVLAEGDKVASRGTITGTHAGPFMGIPASGKAVSWTGTIIYRLDDDGKVIERWQDFDALGMLMQMGVVPPMGPPRPPAAETGQSGAGASPEQLQASHEAAERFFDAVNAHDWAAFDDLLIASCVDHDPAPIQAPGAAGIKASYQAIAVGFPDAKYTVDHAIADDDLIIVRTTIEGTNTGPVMGVMPTGKPMRWTATRMFRVRDGKIVETWLNMDTISLLMQMGVIPPPEAA
jgi:steroid delta-isomerase-like uncharacterized protein